MNDASIPFLEVMRDTVPYLVSRSVAGVLMTTGHVAFAISFFKIAFGKETERRGPTQLAATEGA